MKTLFALFLSLMLFQPLAFADMGKQGCDPGAKLTEKLDLQEDQVDSVKKIMQEQHEKHRDMMQTQREAMKKNMSALHDETRERLSSVLTPEQLQKFDEMHNQRMEKMEQRHEKWKKHFNETSQNKDDESEDDSDLI